MIILMVKKIDSKTICLFISKGVAPIALLIPISLVLSLTVINNIFPIPLNSKFLFISIKFLHFSCPSPIIKTLLLSAYSKKDLALII